MLGFTEEMSDAAIQGKVGLSICAHKNRCRPKTSRGIILKVRGDVFPAQEPACQYALAENPDQVEPIRILSLVGAIAAVKSLARQ
jgi:hypothetical protein